MVFGRSPHSFCSSFLMDSRNSKKFFSPLWSYFHPTFFALFPIRIRRLKDSVAWLWLKVSPEREVVMKGNKVIFIESSELLRGMRGYLQSRDRICFLNPTLSLHSG